MKSIKKLLPLALLLMALPFVLSSCTNDDDLPNIDYSLQLSGGVYDQTNGYIYVVRGETLEIESISVRNLDSNKNAAITGAEYFWDYNFLGNSPMPPYGFNITISDQTALGEHQLTIRTGVVAVDKEPAVGIVNYTVVVVESEDDLPASAVSRSFTTVPGMKSN